MAKFIPPGIYIEETPSSPSEIIRTEDIAVFIGYTEKHQNIEGENLCYIPTIISSLNDFETFFGKAQLEENIEIVDLTAGINTNISVCFSGISSLHNLYYSIKIFFAQGGNSCKIVSVGNFKNIGEPLSITELIAGLDALQNEENNLLIAIPENQNLSEPDFYTLQQRTLEFCNTHRSFTILDVPKTSAENCFTIIKDYRGELTSPSLSFGGTFFPNLVTNFTYSYQESLVKIKTDGEEFSLISLKESNEILYEKYSNCLQQFFVILPPSPAVVGAAIKNDIERGIWKAPANIEVKNVSQPEISINDPLQESLNFDENGKSINAIRKFTGKGTLIWGSRTLAGNNNDWRYIPVRRLVNSIENDIQNALKTTDLHDNSPQIWMQIKSRIESYLLDLWRSGAFAGAKPEQAYYVQCGLNQTMTQNDILKGNFIVEIGVAVMRPAEFIAFRITQKIAL